MCLTEEPAVTLEKLPNCQHRMCGGCIKACVAHRLWLCPYCRMPISRDPKTRERFSAFVFCMLTFCGSLTVVWCECSRAIEQRTLSLQAAWSILCALYFLFWTLAQVGRLLAGE